MKILEKEKINSNFVSDLNQSDIEKILIAKNNYKNTGKSYSIKNAYDLGLSKLDF